MGALLGLIAALAYGASDFVAGIASRRTPVMLVSGATLVTEFVLALVVLVFVHGEPPGMQVLLWGGLSGLGSAVGTVALYQGFAVGSMSIVATVCGVLTVVIPAVVGVAIGNRLTWIGFGGVLIAVVAVALVSWTGGPGKTPGVRSSSGAAYGALAGASFALLFIALERAGTSSGVWPVASGQFVACLGVVPLAVLAIRAGRTSAAGIRMSSALRLPVVAGLLGGLAAFSYLSATDLGQLVIIAVLTSMYPAVTVLLARLVLHEQWNWPQRLGLVLSVASVIVIALA